MKVAIYGAGAMGTVLGAYIAKANEEIDLITHNASHLKGLKNNGAKIIGKADFTQMVNAFSPNEMKEEYDIIFLMTKQLNNKQVVEELVPFLKKDGVICTMQNGLPELSVAEVIGEQRTYGCAMAWGATMIGEGIVELTSVESRDTLTFNLGAFHSVSTAHFKEINRLLSLMGNVTVEDNFIGARWSKLLVNSAFSGMSAILGATFGEIAQNKTSRRIVQKLIKECIDVAKKAEIKIEPIQGKDIVKLLDYQNKIKKAISFMIIPLAIKKHWNLKASMLQDIENGKRTEIDAINGIISAYGDKVGVNTSVNDRVIYIVKKIEINQLKSNWDNLKLLEDLI